MERSAIIEASDDLARLESDARALAQHGFGSWDDLADRWVAHVEHVMGAVGYVAHHPTIGALHRNTVAFIRSPWHRQAVALGWDSCRLFGIHPVAPTVRVGDWGLVPNLALGGLLGLRIAAVTADAVTLRASSGMPLNFPRYPVHGDVHAPWWFALNAIVAQPKPGGPQ